MRGSAYYNEHDPFAADWLRNLISAGHIAPGYVDERDIRDVRPDDLRNYTQHHFFAGIGVWSYALRRAGWHDDRPVATGSCPCQPFSSAGKGAGFADERHLWPAFHWLIQERRPAVVFGEQVASKDGVAWLHAVRIDLESAGYAVGAADLPAAGVGAPHKRQRLFFVAYADGQRLEGERLLIQRREPRSTLPETSRSRQARELAYAEVIGCGSRGERNARAVPRAQNEGRSEWEHARRVVDLAGAPSPTRGFWANAEWLACRDGKARAVRPSTFPLATGVPGRVGRIRGSGNAIVPQVAAAFIEAAWSIGGPCHPDHSELERKRDSGR